TSCSTDLNGNTFHSDSIDVDPDRKVVHQNEFEEKFSDKNLMPEFDQNIEWETLINDVIAVETLLKIIDFDVPKENQSPIQPLMTESLVEGFKTGETSKSSTIDPQSHMYVEECNDDKVRRDAKMSKYLLSPFMIPPESTQRVHKLRPRNKKTKKMGMRLTARDGKFILEWTECNVARKQGSVFLLSMDGKFNCVFCILGTIIGDRHRKTWLAVDTHLDIWVLYLWRYRPAQADWAIAGPFFNTFMLGDKLPCCYVDGVTHSHR
ncbi:hypothetical protein Tco_1471511, partial [Tanacetum coccineum]